MAQTIIVGPKPNYIANDNDVDKLDWLIVLQ